MTRPKRRSHTVLGAAGRPEYPDVITRKTDPPSTYTYGRTGASRPDGSAEYEIDGVAHRFDGKCHADCPNVR